MQHLADFRGGGERLHCGAAAGGVLGELLVAESEPAASRRAGGCEARDEVRFGAGGQSMVADHVVDRVLRLQVEPVYRLPLAVDPDLQVPVGFAAT